MALYALGKLHAAAARQRNLDLPAAEPKAVVFYQASLLVCPQNYMSANDLGVVLRRGAVMPSAVGAGAQRLHLAAIGQPGQPGGRLSAIGATLARRASAAAGRVGPPNRGRAAAGEADFRQRLGAVGRSADVRRDEPGNTRSAPARANQAIHDLGWLPPAAGACRSRRRRTTATRLFGRPNSRVNRSRSACARPSARPLLATFTASIAPGAAAANSAGAGKRRD